MSRYAIRKSRTKKHVTRRHSKKRRKDQGGGKEPAATASEPKQQEACNAQTGIPLTSESREPPRPNRDVDAPIKPYERVIMGFGR